VPVILEKPIAAAPAAYQLQVLRIRAMLLGGHKDEGVAEARKIATATSEPLTLNDLAYYVSDAGFDTGFAKDWAQKAIEETEKAAAQTDLANLAQQDLGAVNLLAAEWDTLGWIYFHQNDLKAAEKYVDASWQLSQHGDVADHLGRIYELQGKKSAAVHMWRLALAADRRNEDAKNRLARSGAPVTTSLPIQASEELGLLRTIKIPGLPKQTGSAEFFLLISRAGIEAAKLIGESTAIEGAAAAIQSAKYEFPFPDDGPEKLIRRGILSCSTYTTPSCQMTLLLPSTTRVAQVQKQSAAADGLPKAAVVNPALISKVAPE
jgi:tetratricopeptide (TPR) repeat protein